MVGKAGLEQRQDQRHLRRVAVAPLTVEADERAAPADRLVHVDLRVHQVAQVPDHHALRLHAGILQYVKLLERGFSRDAGA